METKTAWHHKNDLATDQQVDRFVGARLRLRRKLLHRSQTWLGDAVGLTFQQIQKYEKGRSRIAASRLWSLSRALDVPVSYFFDGLDDLDDGQQAFSPPVDNTIPDYDSGQAKISGQPTRALTPMEMRLCQALRSLSEPQQNVFHNLVLAFTPMGEGTIPE